jgi:hypothetical protein
MPASKPAEQKAGIFWRVSDGVAAAVVAALLGDPEEISPHPEFVLIDGADAFNPASFSGKACSRLLWVRCASAIGMLKAADLLALDGNVPFLLLDATGIPRSELNKLPASSWWRLKQTVERSGARLVVLSAMPLIPCASLRLSLSADLSLRDFDASTPELVERLRATTQQLRHAT